jgi:hypothetical protein
MEKEFSREMKDLFSERGLDSPMFSIEMRTW